MCLRFEELLQDCHRCDDRLTDAKPNNILYAIMLVDQANELLFPRSFFFCKTNNRPLYTQVVYFPTFSSILLCEHQIFHATDWQEFVCSMVQVVPLSTYSCTSQKVPNLRDEVLTRYRLYSPTHTRRAAFGLQAQHYPTDFASCLQKESSNCRVEVSRRQHSYAFAFFFCCPIAIAHHKPFQIRSVLLGDSSERKKIIS